MNNNQENFRLDNQPNEQETLMLPFVFAKRHNVILVDQSSSPKIIYTNNLKPEIIAEVRRFAGRSLVYKKLNNTQFAEEMTRRYHQNSSDSLQNIAGMENDPNLVSLADAVPAIEDLMEQSDDAPVIKLINALLTESIKEEASDIHLETFEKRFVARYRIDGVLREVLTLKPSLSSLLVSRIKVMAKLDIAEKRIPQDGRISLRIAGKDVDVRVSTLPSRNGERVVLRLLDNAVGRLKLEHLGLDSSMEKSLQKMLMQPHGIILVTGPTGSGKTTTLYAGLSTLNDSSRNILTVEDPVEYNIEGIGQTQVNIKVGMTFAKGLRAMLRQDPDVVMVGEIRDTETAEIAIQASLTGHLVLSTLHTNTAVGAIARLQDMGIEPFLLSSSLTGVISQRLLRKLCQNCKHPLKANEYECEHLQVDKNNPPTIYHTKGCKLCRMTGYKGRTGIYELIPIDNEVRRMIHRNEGEHSITAYIIKKTESLKTNGIKKILQGETSLEEVLRVTHQE